MLKAQLEKRWDNICKQNVKASSDRCSELLQSIFGSLEEALMKGIYSKPGGYILFTEEREKLKRKYLQEPRKGIQVMKIYL